MSRKFRLSIELGENYNDPLQFVECVAIAEKYGFEAAWIGDHFFPLSHSGNRSAFVWSVISSALDRTRNIAIGPDVTTPIGGRYHPALIAQASATLDNMYPGRFMLGVGTGEAVNEARFLSHGWPPWKERMERLLEAVELIQRLWNSKEYFEFEGKYFKMGKVFLYTKPKTEIPIYFSAVGPKAARYAGATGVNLVTLNSPEVCEKETFPAYERGLKKAGLDPSKNERLVIVDFYLGEKEAGLARIRELGEAGYMVRGSFEIDDPRRIEQIGSSLSDEEILRLKRICSSPAAVIEMVESYKAAGATEVALCTNSSPELIKVLGETVLPHFKSDGI